MMARLMATSAAHICQRLQEMYPHKLQQLTHHEQSEQSSPFRRWTTGSGAGSSYRHHDHRTNIYNKQMSEGSPAAGGGVARWSLGLEQLLADPAGAAAFKHFLHNEFADENIRFWFSCEQYRQCGDAAARARLAQQIWARHLAGGAPEPVNVDAQARAAATPRDEAEPDLFLPAQKQIFNVMKFDSYPRFLRSAVHAECARAELRGLPLPYAPQETANNTPTKLKKSASNASERRRSGGVNLLPWRLRAGSKDRAAGAEARGEEPPTDVVKSSTSTVPPCALCRVVLPDGATSVVGVCGATPVARLVERLLQRRQLACSCYDVLLTDHVTGESRVVDPSAPSTVLGGRSAAVERRCLVRLELPPRCVAVRCRPERKLKHALRPLVQRYCPGADVAVFRAGSRVPVDTLMEELDGARLKVLLADDPSCEQSCEKSADQSPERELDVDSLNGLAVRLNDETDAQSSTSSVNRSECSSTLGAGAGGARVRAALRPGAPVHHHPPDFLDNLRETQRMRLQHREGEPRAPPPPLPPKPRAVQPPAIV